MSNETGQAEAVADHWEAIDPLHGASQVDSHCDNEEKLVVDVSGFEGPLDLLLELGRRQKVDLSCISILELAEQYLRFIEDLRKMRIELAADYLVMAAWLAFLKSRLLIPRQEDDEDEPSGEELAAMLAFRLQRLEAMRDAASRLVARNRLGRDFFARGNPEPVVLDSRKEYSASLYDLLSAYAIQRQKANNAYVKIARRPVWSLQEARELLVSIIGDLGEWTALDNFLVSWLATPKERVTAIASSFAASLELVREGKLQMRQDEAFAPIYLKGPDLAKPAGTAGSK